jgi:hypothetical protein
MKNIWSINRKQFLLVIAYSAIFPVTNFIGGKAVEFGLLLTFPFLPFAWIGGISVASVFSEKETYAGVAYVIGASVTIFLQVWLCTVNWLSFHRKKKPKPNEPIQPTRYTCG